MFLCSGSARTFTPLLLLLIVALFLSYYDPSSYLRTLQYEDQTTKEEYTRLDSFSTPLSPSSTSSTSPPSPLSALLPLSNVGSYSISERYAALFQRLCGTEAKTTRFGEISVACFQAWKKKISPLPSTTTLSPNHRDRLTGIAVWNNDDFKPYLRQFFYTAQLNKDVFDLIFINRKQHADSKCLNLPQHNITIHPNSNVKVVCMNNEEWWRRHADFLCSKMYGWDCNRRHYQSVLQSLLLRTDRSNMEFKPLRGYIVDDLIDSKSPYWAWMDTDLSLGRLTHFPFHLLESISFLMSVQQKFLFLGGQMTTFNKRDDALAKSWKLIPEFISPDTFVQSHQEYSEEGWWSKRMLRSDESEYAKTLSWKALSDIHGYDHELNVDTQESLLISGRDVLVIAPHFTRHAMEAALLQARERGRYSSGHGSSTLSTTSSQDSKSSDVIRLNKGQACPDGFWYGTDNAQCLPSLPTEQSPSSTPSMQFSYYRSRLDPPGDIRRFLSPTKMDRGYTVKHFSHYLIAKVTLELPSFIIDESMAMLINTRRVEVFNLGQDREQTLYQRTSDKRGPIG